METTIIGAGNMGRGIGTCLMEGGNEVVILDRTGRSLAVVDKAIQRERQ